MEDTAWIDIKPICSNCGHELDFAVVREDILRHDSGVLYKRYNIRPEVCPNCKKPLVGVRIRKEILVDGI